MKFLILLGLLLVSTAAPAQFAGKLPRQVDLGFSMDPPTETKRGATVISVTPGSSAEQIGIQKGDIILKINDRLVLERNQFETVYQSLKSTRVLTFELSRNGRTTVVKGTFPTKPYEKFPDISTEHFCAMTSFKYNVQVIVTRPEHQKGKLPVIFFVKWMSCDPVEEPNGPKHGVLRLLDDLITRSGYVVVRVEKPGLGDSQGPPCYNVSFAEELAAHKAAFSAMLELDFVDPTRVFVVGQSNGGAYSPLVAEGKPVAGYLVSGVWAKTWYEHMLEIERNRFTLSKNSPEEVTRKMSLVAEFYTEYLIKKNLPGTILAMKPSFKEIWPWEPDHQYDLPATYFQELQDLNIAGLWSKVTSPVYVAYGEFDWAMSRSDHKAIADIVGHHDKSKLTTFETIPRMNHSMLFYETLEKGYYDFSSGTYTPDLAETMLSWMRTVSEK